MKDHYRHSWTTKTNILIILSLLLASLAGYAQTGPGGVGNANGTAGQQPQNILWLDAQKIGLSNNALVATWTDRSGNGKNATQTTAVNQPVFKTNYLNGKSVVYLDNSVTGEQDRLDFDGTTLVNTDYTVMIVAARRSLGSKRWVGGQSTSNNQDLSLGWASNTDYVFEQRGSALQVSNAVGNSANVFGIFTHSLESGLTSAHRKLYENSQLLGNRNGNNKLSAYNGASIGRWGSAYYDIDIAEVIFYKSALNQPQRILVENYLSAKYGIAIANDKYAEVSGYTYEVAGIGRDNNTSHTEANTAEFILSTFDGSLDTNGEYLLVGHNNLSNTTSNSNLGTGVVERWARTWYIDKTGSLNAAITFDFSEGYPGGKYPQNKDYYVLLRYNGSTYEIVPVSNVDKSISGDRITFKVSDADLADGQYTLGTTNNSESPVAGLDARTWYSYQSGNWSNTAVWTLDGGVSPLLVNPDNETPQAGDRVIITEP